MVSSVAEIRPGDGAAAILNAEKRYQIAVNDLKLGMFVAELDRPWLDTPFLLQGFLVDSQVELDTLQRYCKYVYVDLELSNAGVADAIRVAEMKPAPGTESKPDFRALRRTLPASVVTSAKPVGSSKPAFTVKAAGDDAPAAPQSAPTGPAEREAASGVSGLIIHTAEQPLKARKDVKIRPETRERFREFVKASAVGPDLSADIEAGMLERAWDWLRGSVLGGEDDKTGFVAQQKASREAIKEILPSGVKLSNYAEKRAMEAELPRARSTFARGEEVLSALMSDVQAGRVPALEEVKSAVNDIVESMADNPDALMWVAKLREQDQNTYQHSVKVALYLVALGRHIGFPKSELNSLGMIGMLADTGKTKVPRNLLEKPGMLTPAEFAIVKEHVQLGLDALTKEMALPRAVSQGIAQHHERLDGSGYPRGLKDEQISIYGKMAAISDSFAALITPRPYASPSAPQDAMMNLYEWAGSSFHEPLVEQFVQAVGVFPVGSLVELSNGEVAVVVAHNRIRRLEPRVLVLTTPEKEALATPIERDLLQITREGRKSVRIVRGLPTGSYGLKLRDYYLGEIGRANGIQV